MLNIKKKIADFKPIHDKRSFHLDLDDVWEPNISLDEYLERIQKVAKDWDTSFP